MKPLDRAAVYAVGRQAFVNGPQPLGTRVPLANEKGAALTGTLRDGAEVEILAWVPGGSGTRYCVRSVEDGLTGWIPVANLRAAAIAATAPTAPPATVWSSPPRAAASEGAPRARSRAKRF